MRVVFGKHRRGMAELATITSLSEWGAPRCAPFRGFREELAASYSSRFSRSDKDDCRMPTVDQLIEIWRKTWVTGESNRPTWLAGSARQQVGAGVLYPRRSC